MQCGTSSSGGGWRPLLTTRVSAADSMLSTAVQIEGACFLCDTAAAFTEVGSQPCLACAALLYACRSAL
jgi:hypothetical protein